MQQKQANLVLPPLPPLPIQEGVEYRHVPGYYGYIAGDDGTLFSVRKPSKSRIRVGDTWVQKKSWSNRTRHQMVHLVPTKGKAHKRFLHIIILETFVGPCPKSMETLHHNGNPEDNRLINIRWGTRAENMADARRHGTLSKGERHGHAKLNQLKVKAINDLRACGWTQYDVATLFSVSQPTISGVDNKSRWSDPNDVLTTSSCAMDDKTRFNGSSGH